MSENGSAVENTKRMEEREKQKKETELLYGTADQFGIYQLKDAPELCHLQFKGIWSLQKAGILKENAEAAAVRPENYDLVYTGDLAKLIAKSYGINTTEEKLHAIFEEFNIYKPADYTGRSLSVSDIVVLHENRKNSAHYVDSTDYAEMPHFISGLEGRQMRQGSLRKTLEECRILSEKAGKHRPAGKQEKEPSL